MDVNGFTSAVTAVVDFQSKGNYAFAQSSILRTTELKVNFKKLVEGPKIMWAK